jgi:HPt (histidine-containing phosphotransfer) domain-containing protein
MATTSAKSTPSDHGDEWRAARLLELESKILHQLPESLAQLQRLAQTIVLEPQDSRHRRQLEMSAHRLRGRAAALHLGALCTVAAVLERLSATDATPAELCRAAAACDHAFPGTSAT